MKYQKLYIGDKIAIDDIEYMVVEGLNNAIRHELKSRHFNKIKYTVRLRSIKFTTERAKEYITIKNTEIENYKHEGTK